MLGLVFYVNKVFFKKLYTHFYIDYVPGSTNYDGINIDKKNSSETRREHNIININTKIGYALPLNKTLQAIPYGGIGYRMWHRAINENIYCTNNATYQSYYANIGIKFNWLLLDNLILSPYMDYGRVFKANMIYDRKQQSTTNKYSGNKINIPDLYIENHLKNRAIYRMGLELDYYWCKDFSFGIFLNHEHFSFGQSDIQNGYQEPDSITNETKYGIIFRYSFS
jgi:outer membrane receptor protein involved in Fe transport